jgi:hypothetical protein
MGSSTRSLARSARAPTLPASSPSTTLAMCVDGNLPLYALVTLPAAAPFSLERKV